MIINWLCLTEVVHVYFYGVPLLREREWELKEKKKKKKPSTWHSHSTTAAFLNPLERRGEKSRLICWTAAARSSSYKNGWVKEKLETSRT